MSTTLRLFVSSVQKELEDERLIVQNLVSTDPFLLAHCTPVLYEFEPASPAKALEGCLASLDGCQAYLLIVGAQYGSLVGDLSITHAEYRRAKVNKLPVLGFIKGERHMQREPGTLALLAELDADGPKYKRFGNVIELQKEVRAALLKLLNDCFGIAPTSDENAIAQHTIEATSTFESRPLDRVRWQELDLGLARRLIAAADRRKMNDLTDHDLLAGAALRGLVWHDAATGEHYATAAGIVMLAKDPSAVFPQCRILADAYRGAEADGDPRDHEDIRGPMPLAIERAIEFIDRNTRHPMRIVGLDRVRLDEYPVDGLREALVNAVAHRQYEDAGRKIILEVFADRVNVLSPGLPPAPLTLTSLRRGKYRPCSRNPVLAQCLSSFHRIEERGSGFSPDARADARSRTGAAHDRHRHGIFPDHLCWAWRERRTTAGAAGPPPGDACRGSAVEREAAQDHGAGAGERVSDDRVVHRGAGRRQGHGAPRPGGPRRAGPAGPHRLRPIGKVRA